MEPRSSVQCWAERNQLQLRNKIGDLALALPEVRVLSLQTPFCNNTSRSDWRPSARHSSKYATTVAHPLFSAVSRTRYRSAHYAWLVPPDASKSAPCFQVCL